MSFQRSELTSTIVRYLAALEKEATVTYTELSKLLQTGVSSTNGHVLSARRILERDHAAVWGCVPSVGLRRLNDAEIAARQNNWYLLGARNKLKGGARQADVVEIEHLDITQQARFATDSIIRELARDALSRATQRRVEKVARGTANDLPAFNAIEWMISLSPRRNAKGAS
jgi:hypothetical protein